MLVSKDINQLDGLRNQNGGSDEYLILKTILNIWSGNYKRIYVN